MAYQKLTDFKDLGIEGLSQTIILLEHGCQEKAKKIKVGVVDVVQTLEIIGLGFVKAKKDVLTEGSCFEGMVFVGCCFAHNIEGVIPL